MSDELSQGKKKKRSGSFPGRPPLSRICTALIPRSSASSRRKVAHLNISAHGRKLLDVVVAKEELAFRRIWGGVGPTDSRSGQLVRAGMARKDVQERGEGNAANGRLRVGKKAEQLEELTGCLLTGHVE